MNIPSGTLLTAFILSFIGLAAASVFGFGLIGQILSVASIFCVAVAFLFLGAWGTIMSLNSVTFRQVDDGKEDVIIVLKMGPFEKRCIVKNSGES